MNNKPRKITSLTQEQTAREDTNMRENRSPL